MAEDLNACVFTGNLTADARTKEDGDKTIARFSIAVNGRKDGETTFVQCTLWRANGVSKFLTKGKKVAVTGRVNLAQWEKEGQSRSSVSMNVDKLHLIGAPAGKKEEKDEWDSPF